MVIEGIVFIGYYEVTFKEGHVGVCTTRMTWAVNPPDQLLFPINQFAVYLPGYRSYDPAGQTNETFGSEMIGQNIMVFPLSLANSYRLFCVPCNE